MAEILKFSRFMKTKERNGIVAVFNSLHPQPVFIDKETWANFIEKKGQGENGQAISELLVSQGLIISNEKEDNMAIENIRQEYEATNKQVSILYLILTHRCNFRCSYCFEISYEDEKREGEMMSNEIVKKGVDLFVNHLKQKREENRRCLVILYGGEPLLNKKACVYTVKYVRFLQEQNILPERTEVVIITNGSMITKELADFFRNNKVSVIVSIDSYLEKVNNCCRVDKNFKGTFSRTMKAIELLKSAGTDLGVSVTITPYNVDSLDKIPGWLKELGINNYGLNRLVGNTYKMIGSNMPEKEYSAKAVRQIINCFTEARKLGIYEDRMGRKINAFISGEFYPTDCGAYGEQIVIQPNGDISICHADWDYSIDSVKNANNLLVWNSSLVRKWKERLPLYKENCLNCEAIGICGGGCAYSAKQCNGSICSLDIEFCRHTKETLDFLIWDLYEQSKNADR